MGKPDPDTEFVIEPTEDDSSERAINQTHDVERIGLMPSYAIQNENILTLIKTFFQQKTRHTAKNIIEIHAYLEYCWKTENAFKITKTGNIGQNAQEIAKALSWPEDTVQKTRQRIIKHRTHLLEWLQNKVDIQ